MQWEFRPIEDHEEWTKIAANSDSGIYTMQGFIAYNLTKNRYVTELPVVNKAVDELARCKGWDRDLTAVSGPLVSYELLEPTKLGVKNYRDMGGWWVVVPVGYLDDLDDPETLSFVVELPKRRVLLTAWEHYIETRVPENKIPEFDNTVEYALKEGTLHMYDNRVGGLLD